MQHLVADCDGGAVVMKPLSPAELTALLPRRIEALKAAVSSKRVEIEHAGFRHNFGGTAGWRTLDTRTDRDLLNWTILKGRVEKLVSAGHGEAKITIRSADNEDFETSANTILSALSVMEDRGLAVLQESWPLKNRADEATAETIDAIEAEIGEAIERGW